MTTAVGVSELIEIVDSGVKIITALKMLKIRRNENTVTTKLTWNSNKIIH
jgi:hypothetical protein